MKITFDPAKRRATLEERGVDFADAAEVFAGPVLEIVDDRFDYGEERTATFGLVGKRMMTVIWTQRGDARHVISMRKANRREQARYRERLG